jgi:hypothetical protein
LSDALGQNASLFNPTDLAATKQATDAGKGPFAGMDENSTVRDFLGQLGIDVDGPVSQLIQFSKDQMGKADPLNKMENIAGAGPAGAGAGPPPMPPGAPQGQPGLEGLMT